MVCLSFEPEPAVGVVTVVMDLLEEWCPGAGASCDQSR